MELITKQYKVFSFEELSEEAQQKVIEKFYDVNIYDGWHDFTIDDFKEILFKKYGLKFDKVYFNLEYRYRQLYFEKIWIEDIKKFIKGFKKDKIAKTDVNFSYKIAKAIREEEIMFSFDTSYYSGGDGRTILSYNDNTKNAITDKYKYLEDLQEWFNDVIVDKMLTALTEEYEYLTSKESIIDTIKANDFQFLEDGEMF